MLLGILRWGIWPSKGFRENLQSEALYMPLQPPPQTDRHREREREILECPRAMSESRADPALAQTYLFHTNPPDMSSLCNVTKKKKHPGPREFATSDSFLSQTATLK